jgi:ankyrin repeat protein
MSDLQNLVEASINGKLEEVRAILQNHPDLVNQKDAVGATPLHYAAFGGHRAVVQYLVQQGADINATDAQFNATPAGWAIEYIRELGGFLSIELADFAHAVRGGDVAWTTRFLERFPGLRHASDTQGKSFRQLAAESRNPEIVSLFEERGRGNREQGIGSRE